MLRERRLCRCEAATRVRLLLNSSYLSVDIWNSEIHTLDILRRPRYRSWTKIAPDYKATCVVFSEILHKPARISREAAVVCGIRLPF